MFAQQHHGLAEIRIAEAGRGNEKYAFTECKIHAQILLRLPVLRKYEPQWKIVPREALFGQKSLWPMAYSTRPEDKRSGLVR
jgi:hypothetical protein